MQYPSKLFKVIPLVLAMAGAFGMYASQVSAAEPAPMQAREFDINPGNLTTALNQFAAAAGVTLSFSTAQTNGINSPGLKGRYSVRQGFDALLTGSGLVVVENGEGVFTLQKAKLVSSQSHEAATLPEISVQSQRENDETAVSAVQCMAMWPSVMA